MLIITLRILTTVNHVNCSLNVRPCVCVYVSASVFLSFCLSVWLSLSLCRTVYEVICSVGI